MLWELGTEILVIVPEGFFELALTLLRRSTGVDCTYSELRDPEFAVYAASTAGRAAEGVGMAPQKHPSSQGAGCALAMVGFLAEVAVDKVAEVSGEAWAASIAGTAELLEEGPLGGACRRWCLGRRSVVLFRVVVWHRIRLRDARGNGFGLQVGARRWMTTVSLLPPLLRDAEVFARLFDG
jgi:hypothetical protein